MRIVGLHNIERQELAVDYRRMYKASAEISVGSGNFRNDIEFSLELTALGSYDISVRFLDSPDFPVVPAIGQIKTSIQELNTSNQLP